MKSGSQLQGTVTAAPTFGAIAPAVWLPWLPHPTPPIPLSPARRWYVGHKITPRGWLAQPSMPSGTAAVCVRSSGALRGVATQSRYPAPAVAAARTAIVRTLQAAAPHPRLQVAAGHRATGTRRAVRTAARTPANPTRRDLGRRVCQEAPKAAAQAALSRRVRTDPAPAHPRPRPRRARHRPPRPPASVSLATLSQLVRPLD
jgi:hypothetical protein